MPFHASEELIQSLCDPLSLKPVRIATEAELVELKRAIASGAVWRPACADPSSSTHADRSAQRGAAEDLADREDRTRRVDPGLAEALEGAFVAEDGSRAYPIVQGLPMMLPEEALELSPPLGSRADSA